MLTAKRLRKVLSYAPTTGIFRWKVSASSRAPVGAIAGAKNGRGYHQIRIGGRPYSVSRLAWLYMTAKWPNSEISYINGNPSDTRWANLREACAPFTDTGRSATDLSATDVCRTVPGDVLPYDSKFVV
jgi:hypothetical protein